MVRKETAVPAPARGQESTFERSARRDGQTLGRAADSFGETAAQFHGVRAQSIGSAKCITRESHALVGERLEK
jgi:hypothetical protein